MRDIAVVLHNIRSIHNVASIFRTADGAGVSKLYLCGITPGPVDRFGREVQAFNKVSLGAEKAVAYEKITRTGDALKKLRRLGYAICAIEQSSNSIPYYKLKTKSPKLALVLGAETTGLPPALFKGADAVLEIPMRGAMARSAHYIRNKRAGHKESLNVAVAFGIVAYHLRFN